MTKKITCQKTTHLRGFLRIRFRKFYSKNRGSPKAFFECFWDLNGRFFIFKIIESRFGRKIPKSALFYCEKLSQSFRRFLVRYAEPVEIKYLDWFGIFCFPYFQHGHYEIRCCNASLHAGEVRAQIVLALAISNAAMTKKYCSPSVSHSDNMRYSFRVWLLNLGLIGDEYKNCRTHLLKHLTGDIAWRHPEDGVAQRERLRQERIAAREQEQRNESPCDERVAAVCDDGQEVGETPDENLDTAVSDCDDFEEAEDICMSM